MKELKAAKKAARAAGRLIQKASKKAFKIKKKGQIDLVTEVDEQAQELIIKILKKRFPDDFYVAEEGDFSNLQKAERRWFIDPIDGTTNFAHHLPYYCVSIAFEKKGKLECAVIYDPTREDLFWAERDRGAYLNKKKIKVSKAKTLKESLLITGFPYDLNHPEYQNLPIFNHLIFKTQAIRRTGSAALDLAYTAAGRFDGFWEKSLKPWDYAAGLLLVKEAGGTTSHLNGSAFEIPMHALLATNGKIHTELLKEIQVIEKRETTSAQMAVH